MPKTAQKPWYAGRPDEAMWAGMDAKRDAMYAQDEASRKAGILVGRVIDMPVADGAAHYVITKENKNTLVVEVQTGIDDDYRDWHWGDKSTVNKAKIVSLLKAEDSFKALFTKKV